MQATLQQLYAALSHAQTDNDMIGAGNIAVSGLTTDSRKVMPGDVFVALRGEHFDAHDFLADVIAKGAVAVVVEKKPANLDVPALVVPNTLAALQDIARYWRQQFTLPVIAVTGSNGKTTVKEMIASILNAHVGAEHSLATSGNLNNEIGVPLTVLRLNDTHRAAVFELGMNHPGEIAVLASVAQATVAMVNNAQREHQEFMQTVQAVAEENGTVLRQLPANGIAVFPADDIYSDLWRTYANETGQRKIVTFGLSADADVSATYQVQNFGSELQMRIAGKQVSIRLAAAGVHNVRNALAAAACCHSIGVSNEIIAAGLQAFSPVNGRLQSKQAHNGARIIDDTYNANPDSVRAAIDVLAPAGTAGVLVLGDMGEVGDEGLAFHQEIGRYAQEHGIAQLLTLGELAQHTTQAYGSGARHFTDVAELCVALDASIDGNSVILIKGSRFMKMERVVAHLTKQQTIGNH
ncbi:UDP-N-acetylmuramoyl-tripeptide--D-alanyl-D-alanine ligase [Undibacterium sp. Jales W-56]|uniref:UDP-N-acetylmuramoyl-tripeptide--D-alanyl-D- alanine ligase n=1 Tax=Undibacterium sp. Jales W-56 TaxID=2897325 RepID=UPI0021D0F450|nr:UDP-N-acetylmuramoyl-tripeptide--D-alanyl-D-alanine ligase [Undibacterium sp. Jales W-56]MCU6432308.1 UDP-N-acetylmuramoyl-tripeptide--D-alanyl-D-alanine ligase [Undibacterium sp. Jales W-56]